MFFCKISYIIKKIIIIFLSGRCNNIEWAVVTIQLANSTDMLMAGEL